MKPSGSYFRPENLSSYILFLGLLLLLPASSPAQLYKCKDAIGSIQYQSEPCQNEWEGKPLPLPPTHNGSSLPPPQPSLNTETFNPRKQTSVANNKFLINIEKTTVGGLLRQLATIKGLRLRIDYNKDLELGLILKKEINSIRSNNWLSTLQKYCKEHNLNYSLDSKDLSVHVKRYHEKFATLGKVRWEGKTENLKFSGMLNRHEQISSIFLGNDKKSHYCPFANDQKDKLFFMEKFSYNTTTKIRVFDSQLLLPPETLEITGRRIFDFEKLQKALKEYDIIIEDKAFPKQTKCHHFLVYDDTVYITHSYKAESKIVTALFEMTQTDIRFIRIIQETPKWAYIPKLNQKDGYIILKPITREEDNNIDRVFEFDNPDFQVKEEQFNMLNEKVKLTDFLVLNNNRLLVQLRFLSDKKNRRHEFLYDFNSKKYYQCPKLNFGRIFASHSQEQDLLALENGLLSRVFLTEE